MAKNKNSKNGETDEWDKNGVADYEHVKVVDVTDCPKFASEIQGVSLKTRFINSTFDANFTVPFNLDENVYIKVIIYSKTGNGWENTDFEMNGDFCYVMEDIFTIVWNKAMKLMKISKPCPVKKGTYILKGLTASYKESELELKQNGEYLMNTVFSKNGKSMACKNIQVIITPD